jgi:hypothetical protein
MIAVKLEGRLGNQLFQYAFIYATAKRIHTKFYMDKSVDYLLLDKYFNIEKDFCSFFDSHIFSIKGVKLFFSHYLRWAFYYVLRHTIVSKQVLFDNNEPASANLAKIKNNRIYIGHFQSAEYFIDYQQDIKQLFSIKTNHQLRFENIFKSFPKAKKYVTIHLRRGDYVDLNWVLSLSYYHNAIKQVHHQDNYYIFISDDVDFIKNEFNYLNDKFISHYDEIIDLQFLTHADVCILSNSSFSWWGAWLNNNPNKIVYAPEYWLGFKKGQDYPAEIGNGMNFNWISAC